MKAEFSSLLEMTKAIPDEQSAIDHFTAVRWKNGQFCPYCGTDKLYHFKNNRTHKCASCHKKFSIRLGTIFEDSNLPIRTWLMAVWYVSSHKKSIASTQLARDLDITQKSAWFVMYRLRHAARTRSFNRPLRGIVESDESFFGGKEKNKHAWQRTGGKQGGSGKAVVIGMLERGGELRTKQLESLVDVRRTVVDNVEPGANLMTDESSAYLGMSERFHHHRTNHSKGKYVKHYFNHVNSVEGFWSLFKHQI